VAEGPGGFIQAIVDVAERNRKLMERATGMTLKPTDHRVPGWRRASTFLHAHKEVKLHYGADGTGDIYQLANQDSFVEAVAPGVHLFTADGGFDFSINYDTQEQRVYHLLLCSATIGLRSLAPEGAFVLKLFDVFSEATQVLLCLIGRCFKEWMLYKPAMSRPCNSERYFLGRGFRGLTPDTLRYLLELQAQSRADKYPQKGLLHPAEEAYLKSHTAANTEEQLQSLAKAMEFSREPTRWYKEQIHVDFKLCRTWCNKHRIPVEYKEPVPIVAKLTLEP
jgi:cap1 methyltransferase